MGKKLLNLILFLLIGAGCVVMTLYVGKANTNVMIYNFVFLGIMLILYMAGMFGGIFRMDDTANALKRGNEEIKHIFKLPGKAKASDLDAIDGMFGNRFLDKKLKDFTDGISKTQEGIGDIEDYINDEELDLHVHKRLTEMIPDIFTSLGILGTFIGLVWGLKDFSPSSYETMTSSVASLVDGIKVAFLTSIYGIALSIVYSYGTKSVYSAMTEYLQSFLNRFHSFVMPSAENESRNLLVATQKIQTDAMNRMAEQFSVQMADSFEKVITPTFKKMNDSLDMLVSSVTRVQTDAVQEILDSFLKQMRSSFQLQFQDFNTALEKMTQAQKENTEFSSELYRSMSRQLGDSFTRQEKAMQDTVTQLGNLQSRFMATASRITEENADIQKVQQQDYEHVIRYMKDAEQSAAKFWVACNQTMKRYVEAASAGMENAGSMTDAGKHVIESNKVVVDEFNKRMKEFNEYQKRSYETLGQVERLLQDISAVGTGDAYLTGGRSRDAYQQKTMDRLLQLMEDSTENQAVLLEEINRNTKELTRNLGKGKFGLFK